jgi:hypothetical protein
MLESLPTLTRLQRERPHIYDASFDSCLLCYSGPEDFIHLWTCTDDRQQRAAMALLNDSFTVLLNLMAQFGPPTSTPITKPDFWCLPSSTSSSVSSLSFVDLIKGCVPLALTSLVHSVTKSVPTTQHIISTLMYFIQTSAFNNIWKPRCDHMQFMFEHWNITLADRKSSAPPGSRPSQVSSSRASDPLALTDSVAFVSRVSSFIHSSVDVLSHFRFISSLVVFVFFSFFWRKC